jgi:hypothetical protein
MEPADLGNGANPAAGRRLDVSGDGAVVLQRLMRTRTIVIGNVGAQETTQMSVIENEKMVEALSSNRANDPLCEGMDRHRRCACGVIGELGHWAATEMLEDASDHLRIFDAGDDLRVPPQWPQVSISILNTRFRRCIEVIARCLNSGVSPSRCPLPEPPSAGVIAARR